MKPERWIDAYNVIHKLPGLAADLGEDPEGVRERFLRMLAPLALRSGERWTLVFDGPRGGRDRAPGILHIVFCRDADAWILDALRRHANARLVTVVSSDEKDIGRAARQLGARVESAQSLVQKLRARRPAQAPPEKPDGENDEGVEYWLDLFTRDRDDEETDP